MKKKPLTDLIFDLDGTLIDSSSGILAAFSFALRSANITPVVAIDDRLIGPPLKQAISTICNSKDPALLDRVADYFKHFYDHEGYKVCPSFHGIEAMLERAKCANLRLHLATNKRIEPTRLILQQKGWNALFDSIYTSDGKQPAYRNKGEMLNSLLAEQAILASSAAYIGDRTEDGEAADHNALCFYAAQWGYSTFDRNQSPTHWTIVQSPAEITF